MRWLTFALLAATTICIQTTVAAQLDILGVRPDFTFILVVHYALHSRSTYGPIAGWLLGAMMDLASVQRPGLISLLYGLAATLIWITRDMVFTRHPLTHFFMTGLSYSAIVLVMRTYEKLTLGTSDTLLSIMIYALAAGLYTGLWAIPIHAMLMRISSGLGLGHDRREALTGTGHVI